MLKTAALLAGVPQVADAKCLRLEQRPTLRVKNASVPMGGALVVADRRRGRSP
ncbi:MAG TPA: hypothetical protein VM513_03220 [Kofleriaceae bacterium]|nr:hypothetical protein [Kofleriaceae bacterium]